MTTVQEIVAAAIPGATDDMALHVLWGRTPYPFGKVTPRDLYRAASRLQRATLNEIELCDFCDRPAVADHLCQSCADGLQRAANPTDAAHK